MADTRLLSAAVHWLAFFRDLSARSLNGVKLVISDAHHGLVRAIGATLPGISWQRRRTHYTANLMAATPKSIWPSVKTLLHSIFDQSDSDAVHAQFGLEIESLTEKLPKVAEHLDAVRSDVLAFTSFPKVTWKQLWTTTRKSLNREIRRRTDVVEIIANRAALIRLVGASLSNSTTNGSKDADTSDEDSCPGRRTATSQEDAPGARVINA